MTLSVPEFIEHYGTKGMKWGVRKKRSSDRTHYKSPAKKLTNAELEKRIKRMETEKKYKSLNKQDLSPGHAAAMEILGRVGKATVTTALTGAAIYGVGKAAEARGADAALVRAMTFRKK
jgi:hypothetical protein